MSQVTLSSLQRAFARKFDWSIGSERAPEGRSAARAGPRAPRQDAATLRPATPATMRIAETTFSGLSDSPSRR